MPDLIGQSLGQYHILEKLGEGGMAIVYKAYDTRLERDVAVKVIRVDQFAPAVLERILKRFNGEAKVVASLTHPNIVGVIDFGEYESSPYMVMPYLPGGTLKQRFSQPMPWQEAVKLLLPIAEALDYAHSKKIIHRDVKPSNILLTQRGQPMLTDFGIAKILESEETQTLTGTGVGVGTPEYMAPEQWTGQAGPKSDIYSLGVVLYELVTGRKPYTADTPAAILLKQSNDPLPRPRQFVPGLPEAVEKVLFKALAKKPEDRYLSMDKFTIAMEALLSIQTKIKHPILSWGQRKAEKSAGTERKILPGLKQIGDQPTRDARLAAEVEPGEPVPQITELAKTKPASPETPHLFHEIPYEKENTAQPGVSLRRKIMIRLAWIIALVGLAVVIAFVILGKPPLVGPLARIPTPSATMTSMATLTLAHTPTLTLTFEPSLTPTLTLATTAILGIGFSGTRLSDGMMMVYVPKGEFTMGGNIEAWDDDPDHKVFLDTYWIDKTEVTNAMYAKCVQSKTCEVPLSSSSHLHSSYYNNAQYENYPVIWVNWKDAYTYCQWAGARLPTEAEWEKAARGTNNLWYPWGNDAPNSNLLNYNNIIGDTTAVGMYISGASPYGALDMAGNVWEWTNDWYSNTYYSQSPASNPQGPTSGISHVLRGGSWFDNLFKIDPRVRNTAPSEDGYYNIGFRCAGDTTLSLLNEAQAPKTTIILTQEPTNTPAILSTPITYLPPPSNLNIDFQYGCNVSIAWDYPEIEYVGFEVGYYIGKGGNFNYSYVGNSLLNGHHVYNGIHYLTPGDSITVSVKAFVNTSGKSIYSASAEVSRNCNG